MFFRYAYPCTEIRKRQGLIKAEHVKELHNFVFGGEDPSQSLLRTCFPDAVNSYLLYIGLADLDGKPWQIETVKKHWRQHEGESLWCAVDLGIITMVEGVLVIVNISGMDKLVHNEYRLPVENGTRVYLHLNRIIEIAD